MLIKTAESDDCCFDIVACKQRKLISALNVQADRALYMTKRMIALRGPGQKYHNVPGRSPFSPFTAGGKFGLLQKHKKD